MIIDVSKSKKKTIPTYPIILTGILFQTLTSFSKRDGNFLPNQSVKAFEPKIVREVQNYGNYSRY
jgi:hypothetical protein